MTYLVLKYLKNRPIQIEENNSLQFDTEFHIISLLIVYCINIFPQYVELN